MQSGKKYQKYMSDNLPSMLISFWEPINSKLFIYLKFIKKLVNKSVALSHNSWL